MKTLNLVNLEASDIKYEISRFPDFQQQLTITHFERTQLIEEVEIYSRFNSWMDLELITCAIASLRGQGIDRICLFAPYVLGARSDRQFKPGSNNYLKEVICPMINSLGFTKVTTLDPHSDCLEMGIRNYRKIDNHVHVKTALQRIFQDSATQSMVLVSPDAGAMKKIYPLATYLGYTGQVLTCSKSRDAQGYLSHTFVPLDTTLLNKDFVIIDDICDGGGTFIEIAKKIKQFDQSSRIHLIVTHSIFSKGFEDLEFYFNSIHTTNSCGDLLQPDATNRRMWIHNNVSRGSVRDNFLIVTNIFE